VTAWNKMMKDFVNIQQRSFYSDGLQKPVDCWDSFIEEMGGRTENVHGVTTIKRSEIPVRLFLLFSAHFDRK